MNKWWRVEIHGRANGRPKEVKATLRAEDELWAAYGAVLSEWPDYDGEHDYVREPLEENRVIRFSLSSGDAQMVFVTAHETFEEMATEVSGAAEVARLEGHPKLPLGMSDGG